MRARVLYISYTGMMEALGASQVLNYLYGLVKEVDIHLISLEKEEDLNDTLRRNELESLLKDKGIKWTPLLYRSGAKGYLSNFYRTYRAAKKIYKQEHISLVHCRSYMPALVAWCIKKTNKKLNYLFDTRGFWFDEKADVGDWSRSGLAYKIAKGIEKKLYLSAKHIVMLSHNGKDTIQDGQLFQGGEKLENISMIPTCVDLERFHIAKGQERNAKLRIAYVGTAIGWYDFPKTVELLACLKKYCDYDLYIYNGGQHNYIEEQLSKGGFTRDSYHLERSSFEDMPKKLQAVDLSVFFIHPLFSKRASAATKLGELLASGIPVITNAGVGDHEYYIKEYEVGMIVCPEELDKLDFGLFLESVFKGEYKERCRILAEKYFSLTEGIKEYQKIYEQII